MRNPSDTRFKKITALHQSGQMVGPDRPVGRVTFTKARIHGNRSRKPNMGRLRHLNKSGEPEVELWNVASIDIDRGIGQDAATCVVTIRNADPETSAPEGIDSDGRKGYLTPGRGVAPPIPMTSLYVDDEGNRYPTLWGYPQNEYKRVLIPNTIIKTYQGYGSDNFDDTGNGIYVNGPDSADYVAPADDTQLYLTGTWLVDRVTFDHNGSIRVQCRDLAKLLIEQYIYPPMIPMSRFPLVYKPAHHATGHREFIGRNVASFHSSSADDAAGPDGSLYGHRGSHAFDTNPTSFWFSEKNFASSDYAWLQARVAGRINEVTLHTWRGNYRVYVSVYEDGKWKGTSHPPGSAGSSIGNVDDAGFIYVIATGDTLWDLAGTYYGNNFLWPIIARANNNIIKDPHWIYPGQRIKIPYVKGTLLPPPAGYDSQSGINVPYVVKATVPSSGKVTISLPRTYDARYVRVLFTRLKEWKSGDYRVGVRTMRARYHRKSTFNPSTIGKAGYLRDWSEAVKELAAWAGFTWPNASPLPADPVLGHRLSDNAPMRVWGDFERLGAGPIVDTPGDYFMSKSFMEGIRQIVDFIGGVFYIDETGGAQFRLPNIWSGGNFIDDPTAPQSIAARTKHHPIEFHEDANLISYEMSLSDEAVRSEILVIGGYPNINSSGPVAGGYTLGYNPATGTTSAIDFTDVLAGQYRLMVVPGDATSGFKTAAECQRMAELTALFILFTYRQGTLTAPGHPGLQLDDQVRIFERTTHETNVHYVSAIKSHQDLDSGEYTMEVTTHWLGNDPNRDWFVNKSVLTTAVKQLPAIMKRLGSVT